MSAAKSLRILENDRNITAVLYPEFGRPSASPVFPEKKSAVLPGKPTGKIALPTMEGLHFEKSKHVLYLEASGNYTMLHFIDGRQVLVCKTLREVETMLPPDDFIRIHRSHTIQLRHLKKYIRGKGGYVVLQNGATLAVSAGQKDVFMEAVHQFFN